MQASAIYSVIQFSARPSSFEYVNVGVVVAIPGRRDIRVLVNSSAHKVQRLFENQGAHDFKAKLGAFKQRIVSEFSRSPSVEHMALFAEGRANAFRLLPFLPISVEDIDSDASSLFRELVGELPIRSREPAIRQRLGKAFIGYGVERFLDKSPEPVSVPFLSQPIKGAFGYQNGHYNIIDAVSLAKPEKELDVLGRVSQEAKLLKQHSDKRLVVVADIPPNRDDLISMIRAEFLPNEARLFRFDDLHSLADEIRHHAQSHNSDLIN